MSDYFYTWRKQGGFTPLEVTGTRGVHFESGGQEWLDLGSLSYQANLGLSCEPVIESIRQQATSLPAALPNWSFPAKDELARKLLAAAPKGFSKVFFTLGGAEANENAYKIARLVTGRHKVMTRYNSYHGATMGALTMTGDYRRPPLEPGIPGVVRLLDCPCRGCQENIGKSGSDTPCAKHIEDTIAGEGRDSIAAILLETVPGANGVRIPSPTFLSEVKKHAARSGALLILDEVLVGFGRLGSMFGFEQFGVIPDMITLAKGLTAGYAPLGAVLVSERVASHFEEQVLYAGLTNYAHPIACAAANAALDVYPASIAKSKPLQDALSRRVAELGKLKAVSHFRSIGLLAALDVELDDDGYRKLASHLNQERVLVHLYSSRRSIVIAPALTCSVDDLHRGLGILEEGVRRAV